MSEADGARTTIGTSSRVSIALLGGIFAVLLGASVGAARWSERVDNRLQSIEVTLDSATRERWTAADMARWVQHLQDVNPAMRIPLVGGFGGK